MKKWTEHQAVAGNTVSPKAINDEMSAHKGSITTLDRDQLPADFVGASRLEDNAMHRVWVDAQYPSVTNEEGEQQAVRETSVSAKMWEAVSYQQSEGGWSSVSSAVALTGFKGGSLFIEWSGVGYIYPAFSDTGSLSFPFNPKYLNLRILVAGVVIAERRGVSMHEAFRVFGCRQLPPGDHSVLFQFRVTPNSRDDALTVSGGSRVIQAHLYANKYFAIGRFR